MTHHQFQIGSSGSRTRNNEQTTGLSHPRVWTAVILLCLLYSNGVPALAQDPADRATITESGPTARVDARLGDLERECNRVEADMDGSALRGSEPPQFFRNRMGLLRVNLRLAIEQLAGQPRQEVQPLLDRISGVVTEATTGNPIGGCHVYCLDQQGHATPSVGTPGAAWTVDADVRSQSLAQAIPGWTWSW